MPMTVLLGAQGLLLPARAMGEGRPASPAGAIFGTSAEFARAALVDARMPGILAGHKIAGVGIALIHDSRVTWERFYGEQGPGVPASANTMFNTASVAKSITAETVLRLVSQGKVALDEPIANYYVEPDLADDPRYKWLTPRLILSHRSGLRNWRYEYEDHKFAFIADPGTRFGYSGAAFDMLAKFLERKLQKGFETLVSETVLGPLGMASTSMSRKAAFDSRVTTPMDASGQYGQPYTAGEGDMRNGRWSSAADLFISIDDYSKFIISVMRGEGMTPLLQQERWWVESSFAGAQEWECLPEKAVACPDPYGFGLGWLVFDYGGQKFAWSGGNDSGENALAYWYPGQPGDAVIVFINGGNGVMAMPDIVDLIDPAQKWSGYVRELIARHLRK